MRHQYEVSSNEYSIAQESKVSIQTFASSFLSDERPIKLNRGCGSSQQPVKAIFLCKDRRERKRHLKSVEDHCKAAENGIFNNTINTSQSYGWLSSVTMAIITFKPFFIEI